MNLVWVIIITLISGVVGTGLGGLIGALFKKDSTKTVSLLLGFAGGVMLAVVCFDLLKEAVNPVEGVSVPWYIIVISTALGYLIVFLLNKIIDTKLTKEVPHTSNNHPDAHDNLDEMIHSDHYHEHKKTGNNLFTAGFIMALVIALHNLPEGMVIGATYALPDSTIIGSAGFLIATIIGIHNIPEGMAISVPLISGGSKKWKAILAAALSGLPIVLGAIIGFLLGGLNPIVLSICLSLASGAMLYVVFGELLPESILMWKSKLPALFGFLGLLVGFILVFIK